jgi:predicted DsbA family dithiol-disulfide isomerase
MDIQVWSDVICPWCYLGRRRLEEALRGDNASTVTYRAFLLDPAPVPPGMPLRTALAAKFGGPAQAEQMFTHVRSIAAVDGIELNFDRAIAANTLDAHRLIAWAASQARQAAMLDALQVAHFSDGVDIGSHTSLARVAESIGFDRGAVLDFLGTRAGMDAVNADLHAARELGITSVPTFVIDGKYAVQGAQEVSTLRSAFAEIQRRESVAS